VAGAGASTLAVPRRHAHERRARRAAHPVRRGDRFAPALDVTREEIANGLFQGLRLAAVGLAFGVYALLLDHDRLLAAAGWARRSTLAVGLATRLVPLLERDARDLRVALRGRNVELGPVRQLSPLLAGSLERGLNLAEAMEARGYGRAGHTRAPRPPWRARDYAVLALSAGIVVGGLWL